MKLPWMRSALAIAALFSFRMLGLFMLIPVFSVYAVKLTSATPALIGIALGAYGLSQGLLQMPLGMLSDRFGRKTILAIGLLLFMAGSLLGALTESIYGMILARILQGTGAIGSVLIALLADLTPDQHRTKAMAVIGATIGLSFTLALIISPAIANAYGLHGIFYFTVLLAVLGLMLLTFVIPNASINRTHLEHQDRSLRHIICNKHLQRLNAGIFCQHFILTSTFFSIPLLVQQQIARSALSAPWQFYAPIMIGSFVAMLPLIAFAEKKNHLKMVFLSAISLTTGCQVLLAVYYPSWLALCGLTLIYFIAFNYLEASLPSLVSRQASLASKGAAMGLYSSCQYLGIFAGGVFAGFVYAGSGSAGVFWLNASIGALWLIISAFMQPHEYQTTLLLKVPKDYEPAQLQSMLKSVIGINQTNWILEDGCVSLSINRANYQPGSAEKALKITK